MSSRAIPNGSFVDIESFEPQQFRKNQSGMEASNELVDDVDAVRAVWNDLITLCKAGSKRLSELGLHKQWTNRPNDWHVMAKGVLSGTDWDNFNWLRNDLSAQPEFQELARCLQAAFDNSVPEILNFNEWHLPYIKSSRDVNGVMYYFVSDNEVLTLDEAKKISTSCCAQVSYRKLNDSKEKALDIYEKLFSGAKKHMSPTEHQGTPIYTDLSVNPWNPLAWPLGITHICRDSSLHSGNLSGWIQHRQLLPDNVYSKKNNT